MRKILNEDNVTGGAVKTGGKYLCRLITTAEKASAEAVKTAGKTRTVLKQQGAVILTVRRQQRIEVG